ncbi:MAG: molybdopterin-dependent oxidoreductase [Chloroflexi bacterium]|nr:molybdopterin-dependent oxidoreductase [Chloroflexota bacterium]
MAEQVFYNTCPAAGCHLFCAVKVRVRDGRIAKVESADYPGQSGSRMVCLRGLSAIRFVYHPDRLKYPLKRAGKRGEGNWQRITWDEALDEIAGKLLDIKIKYGPEAVKIVSGGSSSVGLLNGKYVGQRFASLWGAGGEFEAKGWFSDGAVPAASLWLLGNSGQSHPLPDLLNSKMIVLWGRNTAVTNFLEMKTILDAKERGAKLVVISPLFDATAAKADTWVPVRAGSDSALAMAMINVVLERNLHDVEYLKNYTVGPFLVRDDNRQFLRQAGEYMVWDEGEGAAQSFRLAARPALAGSYNVNGIACTPAFELLRQRAALYTPAKAAVLTSVPAETIVRLAEDYARDRPHAIKMGYGLARMLNSNLAARAIITLAAVTGNIGVPGGGASSPVDYKPFTISGKPVTSPPRAPGEKKIPGSPSAPRGWDAIRQGKYPVKALLFTYTNYLSSYGQLQSYLDIFSKIDLITVADVFMTRTAQHADIVLPEATIFERDDICTSRDFVLRMEKAIEPLHESRPAWWIWTELARRVGLGGYFNHTAEDYISMLLDQPDPALDGITLERLNLEKLVHGNVPSQPPIPFKDKAFRTPSGKIEFYIESLADLGEELPLHKEPLESPRSSPLARLYPLSLLTVKPRNSTHTVLSNVDWLVQVEPRAYLDINPIDAQPRGIRDEDIVEVFNNRGRMKLRARLNQTVPPGTVNTSHGSTPEQFIEGHYNDLLYRVDDIDAIDRALEREPIVSDLMGGATYNSFDCLVEVRKAGEPK